jgi:hypothetical protein
MARGWATNPVVRNGRAVRHEETQRRGADHFVQFHVRDSACWSFHPYRRNRLAVLCRTSAFCYFSGARKLDAPIYLRLRSTALPTHFSTATKPSALLFARRLVKTTDQAFTLATADGEFANLIRLWVAPAFLQTTLSFEAAAAAGVPHRIANQRELSRQSVEPREGGPCLRR